MKFSADYNDSWQHGRLHIAFRLAHRIRLLVLNTLYNSIFTKMECRYKSIFYNFEVLLKKKVLTFFLRIFCIFHEVNHETGQSWN